MSRTLAAVIGGVAGALALVLILIFLVWFSVFRSRNRSRTSETGSSDPSCQAVGRNEGMESSIREARRFDMEELSQATKNFNDQSLIGEGKFGDVYKGLLQNGMLVAIKKRSVAPTQEFVDEVRYLSSIRHRNLVTLLGYCQESNMQFLVYEYVPNGSVSSHLYGSGKDSRGKKEFKHRLSIAIGAATGLAHIHSLSPRLVHKNFKTANVLVDENFVAKVADAGLRHFLGRVDGAGPSSQITADEIFFAPEVREFRRFSEKSDVYSFGIFLLELVSGRQASELAFPDSKANLVEWVQSNEDCKTIIDTRLGNQFTSECMESLIQLIAHCLDVSSERRPGMSNVVTEVEAILEKEVRLTTLMSDEGTPTVTLGSQLFKATK